MYRLYYCHHRPESIVWPKEGSLDICFLRLNAHSKAQYTTPHRALRDLILCTIIMYGVLYTKQRVARYIFGSSQCMTVGVWRWRAMIHFLFLITFLLPYVLHLKKREELNDCKPGIRIPKHPTLSIFSNALFCIAHVCFLQLASRPLPRS